MTPPMVDTTATANPTASDAVALSVRGAHKTYGGVTAVNDVSFDVPHNTVVGLLGPNGAGKTTLVDLITGIQRPDRADMVLGGRPLRGSATARSRLGLARTFQHPQLIAELSALDNIMIAGYARRLHGVGRTIGQLVSSILWRSIAADERERCVATLADFDMPDMDTPAGDLSLGEQRLIEVARALMVEPTVMLLDEPFAGSDPTSREAIIAMIHTVVDRGCSVILVDHNVDIVTAVADRIVLMSEGSKVLDAPAADALGSRAMRDVYFGTTHDDDAGVGATGPGGTGGTDARGS